MRGAMRGEPMCQTQMGIMLEEREDGSPPATAAVQREALEWYHKAALQGENGAAGYFGGLWREGCPSTLPQDFGRSAQWLRIAAVNGNDDAAVWVLREDPFAQADLTEENVLEMITGLETHLRQLYERISK